MFGGKKDAASLVGQVETLIGKDTQLKGTITTKGSVRIDGQFDGEITAGGDIVVGETGQLTAQLVGRNALIAGRVIGNCDISEKLELLPSGQIYGDIKVGTLIVGEGAVFKGGCTMHRGEEAAASKPKK